MCHVTGAFGARSLPAMRARGATAIKTELSLDSDEPPERVAQLIEMAEATRFTLAALRNPAPLALEQAMGAVWRAHHLTAP